MKNETIESKSQSLTSYYENLPRAVQPKTDFVERISKLCGVNTGTVRLWVKGKTKPENEEHIAILVKETGIESEQLFCKKL